MLYFRQVCFYHASVGYAQQRLLCFHFVQLPVPMSHANVDVSAGRVSPLHTCSGEGIIYHVQSSAL